MIKTTGFVCDDCERTWPTKDRHVIEEEGSFCPECIEDVEVEEEDDEDEVMYVQTGSYTIKPTGNNTHTCDDCGGEMKASGSGHGATKFRCKDCGTIEFI